MFTATLRDSPSRFTCPSRAARLPLPYGRVLLSLFTFIVTATFSVDSWSQYGWFSQFGTSVDDDGYMVAAGSYSIYVLAATRACAPSECAILRSYTSSGYVRWQVRIQGGTRWLGTMGVDDKDAAYVPTWDDPAPDLGVGHIRKFSADGHQAWDRTIQLVPQTGATAQTLWVEHAIVVGTAVFVAGVTSGTIAGQSSQGNDDLFVARYDLDGTMSWLHQFGGSGREVMNAMGANSQGVFIAGSSILGTSPDTSFLTKFYPSGARGWTVATDDIWGLAASDDSLYAVIPVYGPTLGTTVQRFALNGDEIWHVPLQNAQLVSVAVRGSALYLGGSGPTSGVVMYLDTSGNSYRTQDIPRATNIHRVSARPVLDATGFHPAGGVYAVCTVGAWPPRDACVVRLDHCILPPFPTGGFFSIPDSLLCLPGLGGSFPHL